VGVIALAVMLSILAVQKRVIGMDIRNPAWNNGFEAYQRLERQLLEAGVARSDVVMVNNAPGYFVANQRSSISIPDGSTETLLTVARRYGARYVLLEQNHPKGLADLYVSPGDLPGMNYLFTFEGAHVFEIVQ
jgi:hypothetical protein